MKTLIIGAGVMAHHVKDLLAKEEYVGMLDYLGNGDFKSFNEITKKVDVIIDFSNPIMLDDILKYSVNNKIPLLIASTGHSKENIEKIKKASLSVPITLSTNTSIGVNALNKIVKYANKILQDFDVEIIEKHHNRKIDAPSGTANTLLSILQEDKDLNPIYDRHNIKRKREKEDIGIHSIRCGNIVGEHSVIFSKDDEIIEINHTALSRKIFAQGAIKIARFLINSKEPKLYETGEII